MNVIVWVKQLFRGRKQKFEVWDTSAISIWTDKLEAQLESEDNTVIVVPEVVMKQLSEGRHKFERARKAYKYLLDYTGDKLRFAVANEKRRALPANEQVISIVGDYYNKGYDVTLVTCNHTQSLMAGLRKYNELLLAGNRESNGANASKQQSTKNNQKAGTLNMAKTRKEVDCNLNENEKQVKCKRIGKDTYIIAHPGVAVYDNRSKRRIGKNGRVMVRLLERVVWDDVEYMVKSITETHVILKRM